MHWLNELTQCTVLNSFLILT